LDLLLKEIFECRIIGNVMTMLENQKIINEGR